MNFRILAALLLSMGMGMAGNVVHRADFFLAHPYMGWLFPANEFLYGPLFFLYVVSMLNRKFWMEAIFFPAFYTVFAFSSF
ncbi:hypothetical protein [Algoriphagus antarcticus]|uniref:hypothetical protein n=1 Tax=Algoriphagus antarcticus TaxID=238540 RepID=UPI001B8619CC|nr:hypothetical protein [Algoriphagus antarcticus]